MGYLKVIGPTNNVATDHVKIIPNPSYNLASGW